MIDNKYWMGGLAGALILAGCGSGGGGSYTPKQTKKVDPASIKAGEEANVFPWKVGNQWTYTLEGMRVSKDKQASDPVRIITYKLTEIAPVEGGEKATFEISQDGAVVDRQVWLRNAKGIFQVSVSQANVPFSPMQPALVFPVKDGSKFKWTGTGVVPGGDKGKSTTESTVVGAQEIDTENGRMSGIAIETQTTWSSGNLKGLTNSVAWWSPGYGIVRFKQTAMANDVAVTQLLKLKTATLK